MSWVNRLNRMGDRIAPCGTPLYKGRVRDDVDLWITLACLPDRKLANHFLSLLGSAVLVIF